MQSPAIALPAGTNITLTFRFFFAHLNNASSQDMFRARVVGANGQVQTVFARGGTAITTPGAGGVPLRASSAFGLGVNPPKVTGWGAENAQFAEIQPFE